jgi:hypothetical protein
MPNSSPFFTIFDDQGNPLNKVINQAADTGNHFGDSKSLDADGKKYPKGFTPPVDYYVDPNNFKTVNLIYSTQGPVEGGNSLIFKGEIVGGNQLNKTEGSVVGGIDPTLSKSFNPGPQINQDNLQLSMSWVQPDNIDSETGYEVEYGKVVKGVGTGLNADDRVWVDDTLYPAKFAVYDLFNDNGSKEFTHLLDYFMASDGSVGGRKPVITTQIQDGSVTQIDTKNLWLQNGAGSFFVRTTDDNEDPTILGYDIEIKALDSPLFNGEIETFITTFANLGNEEIKSRMETLVQFKHQLLKFIKTDVILPNFFGVDNLSPDNFDGQNGAKIYYMKTIGGLDRLVESWDSSESGIDKQFVSYGKDFITLAFNEDVSQNIAYLSSLYKSLTWSRLRGKQIIPENLLRFDIEITVSDIRKYNRIISLGQNINVISDLVSKYTYRLYECQFFFTKMPQGDSLDLGKNDAIDSYEFKFNYKFSTMRFTKFIGPTKGDYVIDNSNIDLSLSQMNFPKDAVGATSSSLSGVGQIQPYSRGFLGGTYYQYYGGTSETTNQQSDTSSGLQNNASRMDYEPMSVKFRPKEALGKPKPWDKLGKDLANAAIREVNRQIITQAALLNKTLDNIRNSIPGAGRMNAPTNVYYDAFGNYTPNGAPFQNDVINSLRNFVGSSVKGFFQNP